MSRPPRLKGKEIIKILFRAGFTVLRVKGSHHFLSHQDGRCTVVPVHSGEEIGVGLFCAILRDVEMTIDEFKSLM